MLKIINYADSKGIDYNASSLKKVICIGEPIRNSDFNWNTLGKQLKDKWDIDYYSTYASTEMSTAFTECTVQNGGHQIPELIIKYN